MELQNSSARPMFPIIRARQDISVFDRTHRPLIDQKNEHYPNPAIDLSKSSRCFSKHRTKPQYSAGAAAVRLLFQIPRLIIEDELQQYQYISFLALTLFCLSGPSFENMHSTRTICRHIQSFTCMRRGKT